MLHPVYTRLLSWLLRWLRPRESAVLHQVNLARRALGKPPLERLPTGQPSHMRRCPLAQAFGGLVGCYGVAYTSHEAARRVARAWGTVCIPRAGRYIVYFPSELTRFVQHYDLHAFPRLALRPTLIAAS